MLFFNDKKEHSRKELQHGHQPSQKRTEFINKTKITKVQGVSKDETKETTKKPQG